MKNNKKYIVLTLLGIAISQMVYAQEKAAAVASASDKTQEFNHIMQWVLLLIIAVLVIVTGFISVRVLRMYQNLVLAAIAKEEGRDIINLVKEETAKESLFDKIRFQLFGTGAVELEKEEDIMIMHPHDGIYELDNRLPPWWVSMFYATIIFGVGYFAYYHYFTTGKDQISQYKEEVRKGDIIKAQEAERQANLVNENTVTAVTEQARLEVGKEIFIGKCAACHGQKGEGGVGPNLTDEYWLHGGSIKKIFTTIKNGVPEKGMIAWKDQVKASDIQSLSSYILTLKGTNPPNAKAPQGVIDAPEAGGTAAPATDTIKTAAPKATGK